MRAVRAGTGDTTTLTRTPPQRRAQARTHVARRDSSCQPRPPARGGVGVGGGVERRRAIRTQAPRAGRAWELAFPPYRAGALRASNAPGRVRARAALARCALPTGGRARAGALSRAACFWRPPGLRAALLARLERFAGTWSGAGRFAWWGLCAARPGRPGASRRARGERVRSSTSGRRVLRAARRWDAGRHVEALKDGLRVRCLGGDGRRGL